MPPKESIFSGLFPLKKIIFWEFSEQSGSCERAKSWDRVWERGPTWDKVTTHYAALPHFVVLNGLNKCNNKTVSQALKYSYRKILFCSLYVNRSTASGECVPDQDPDTTRHPSLTRFSPCWQIFCASQSHFLLRTFTHSHTHTQSYAPRYLICHCWI